MSDTSEGRWLAEQLSIGLRAFMLMVKEGMGEVPVTRQQLDVLGSLSDGPRRVTDLAGDLGVRMPTVTTQLARLERDGMIVRGRDEGDGRVVMVSLTIEGRKILRHGLDLWYAWLTDRIERLGPAERVALEAALPALKKLFPLSVAPREAVGSTDPR